MRLTCDGPKPRGHLPDHGVRPMLKRPDSMDTQRCPMWSLSRLGVVSVVSVVVRVSETCCLLLSGSLGG